MAANKIDANHSRVGVYCEIPMVRVMTGHDIFICFSSKDEATARRVVSFLEGHGVKCWISARDVEPGQNYQESIVQALESAKAIVFLFSENSSKSGEIKKELSLGAGESIAVIPLRLSPVLPSGALRYELATRQWIDAFPNLEDGLGKLLNAVKDVLRHPAGALDASAGLGSAAINGSAPSPTPARRTQVVSPGSDEFEAVRGLLARHIGPIAKVLMQKAANDARSLDDFCERLGTHVQAPKERAAFIQAARAKLALKS
jgi:hypothetical protein